jgi:gamma-glutamylputrescine oxidase
MVNWLMMTEASSGIFNGTLGIERSYYAATANRFASAPALNGATEADLCVVGGGCTGLSAALHARERGYSVVLLEGGRIGWGASGRNGGQMIPGLRKSAPEMIRLYGEAKARLLFDLSVEAMDLVVGLIQRHGISCDLELTGHIEAAWKPREVAHLAAEAECLASKMGYSHATLLSAAEMHAEVDSKRFHGGLLDRFGGHFHTLNYALGLADAARAAGVTLYENSPATRIDEGGGLQVITPEGVVKSRFVLLACDAFLGDLDPRLAGRIMPVGNYVVATEPLPPSIKLIPNNRAVSDTKFVVDYFRMTADNRLLFGGGERYSAEPPRDIAGFVRPYMLDIFPQLGNIGIDHAWGGLVSVTLSRMPDIGRRGNLFHAHGYSGKGAILSTLAGKLAAEAIAGTAERFDLLAGIAPPAFPGGSRLRSPLYILGMLWYALRDRL